MKKMNSIAKEKSKMKIAATLSVSETPISVNSSRKKR
jgi:hypothetical protein